MLSRCFSLLVVGILTLPFAAFAQEERTSTEGGEWLERSRQLIEESETRETPDWMRTDPGAEAMAIAEEIARESGMRPDPPEREVTYAAGNVLIFGSFSMPDETLRNLMEAATEPGVTFVLRGMVGGEVTITGPDHDWLAYKALGKVNHFPLRLQRRASALPASNR